MQLRKVHVREFQSIQDSLEFEVGDITCLVGKNEAGKTALLQALYRLNPIVPAEGNFSVTDDYPRWHVEDYRLDVEAKKRTPAIVTMAVFELDEADLKVVTDVFGPNALKQPAGPDALKTPTLTLKKGYANTLELEVEVNTNAVLAHLVSQHLLSPAVSQEVTETQTVEQALSVLANAEQTDPVKKLQVSLSPFKGPKDLSDHIANKLLLSRVPKFLYFDEYYQMVGHANIEELIKRKAEKRLLQSDYPLLGLINRARLTLEELLNPSRTRELKNRLEGSGNHLTKQIIRYWSQNRYLQLKFDVRPARPSDPVGLTSGTNIWGDVYDSKHGVTTEMGSRSRGFVWFFSFLAWYGDIRAQNQSVILLLDEPGLTLHAKAQRDLLRYFDAEVKGNHQLLYSTHSPFMIDPARFDRVRIVQDLSIESDEALPPEQEGTKVIEEVLDATSDSLFPLQGALGYEITQTLFIGPNSLIVEGPSDLLYLRVISAVLEDQGRTPLSTKWTITPVGGAEKVPTFVALIGAQKDLNIAALVDYQKAGQQLIENLYKRKLLKKKQVLTFADYTGTAEADIEDMFEVDYYIEIVNREYKQALASPIDLARLPPGPRVLYRIEKHFESTSLTTGHSFSHYRPARYLTENIAGLKAGLTPATLDRFEKLFTDLNALVK